MSYVQGGALNQNLPENKIVLDLSEVLNAVEGVLLSEKNSDVLEFMGVATDSRNVQENFVFFPLVGKQDGHKFISSAVENGAKIIFVNEYYSNFHLDEINELKKQNLTVIRVSHTMYALQKLAALYVSKFPNLIKIGITGSSGKTTTKEIAVSVLKQKFNVVYNEGNLNSETGLPLSVFKIRPCHQLGIFEMGMNRKGEISELASVLKPKYAIITNIGTAHIGILGSRRNIADEKKQIFKFFTKDCVGFIPEDDDFVDFLADAKGQIKKYGFSQISQIENLGLNGTSFNYDGEKITLSLCGKYNLKNCLSVISLAKELGLSNAQIKAGIENVKPIFGRNQILQGDVTVVQDCYNANPDSMSVSIDFFDSVKTSGKKIFILGDMLELGFDAEDEHEKIAKMVEKSSCDVCVFFGNEMTKAYKKVFENGTGDNAQKKTFIVSENTQDCDVECIFEKLKPLLQKDDLVLLKGSRGMALERFSQKIMGESNK